MGLVIHCTKIGCVLVFARHQFMLRGILAGSIKVKFVAVMELQSNKLPPPFVPDDHLSSPQSEFKFFFFSNTPGNRLNPGSGEFPVSCIFLSMDRGLTYQQVLWPWENVIISSTTAIDTVL